MDLYEVEEPHNRVHGGGHADKMLQQAQASQIMLSQMADTKATIMLTVASLVIPLSSRLIDEPSLHWAALTMIAFSGLTVLLAAYAAMPKVGLSKRRTRRFRAPDFNVLFFGDFSELSYDQFKGEMLRILANPKTTYESQIRDLYNGGLYLAGNKYKFIRLAYLTFMAGILASSAVYLGGQALALAK